MSSCSRLAAPWRGIALVSVARASLPVLQKHGGLTMTDHVSTENVDDGGRAAGADSQTPDEFGAVDERNTELDEGTDSDGRSVRHHYQEMKWPQRVGIHRCRRGDHRQRRGCFTAHHVSCTLVVLR
jgi:hypothetical protein